MPSWWHDECNYEKVSKGDFHRNLWQTLPDNLLTCEKKKKLNKSSLFPPLTYIHTTVSQFTRTIHAVVLAPSATMFEPIE
jgi:hypothetical protein